MGHAREAQGSILESALLAMQVENAGVGVRIVGRWQAEGIGRRAQEIAGIGKN
jgi:hypothetical protein